MNINFIDTELNVKIKETFKIILKDKNTSITFDEPLDDIEESITIKLNNHIFIIEKYVTDVFYKMINEKYFPYIRKSIIDNSINLSTKQLRIKTFYLIILKPFFGDIVKNHKDVKIKHKITYNGITIDLTTLEFDRLCYYTKYVYKLQQLQKLNKELKIEQEFNIIFDDDQAAHKMYDNIYNTFKDIIKPFNDSKLDDYEDDDDDDDDNIDY